MINSRDTYRLRFVEWNSQDAEKLIVIRLLVFVNEQKVPADLELDELDRTALHILAENSTGQSCGTGRLFTDPDDAAKARIGRMAVLNQYRRTGCGTAILTALIDEARLKNFYEVELSAQLHAVPFYQKFGFQLVGPLYDDCGIPHQSMTLRL